MTKYIINCDYKIILIRFIIFFKMFKIVFKY